MRLKILGSGSSGNCYILESDTGGILILEAGIHADKMKQAINYEVSRVSACLISHEDGDHCRYVYQYNRFGIPCYMSTGTGEYIKTANPRGSYRFQYEILKAGKTYRLRHGYNVFPFDSNHDAVEPMGFYIHHMECGRLLFLTDSYYTQYRFERLNNVMIEANFCEDILYEKEQSGSVHPALSKRIRESHMSIQTCITFLKNNDLSEVNNIILIHLSDTNSDAERFKRMVHEATGKNVVIANAGIEIDLNKTPF